MMVRSHTPDPDADGVGDIDEVFNAFARGILDDAQLRTIQFHYERDDLSNPVYVLMGTDHAFHGTTTSREEAEIHMKENPAVRSYISSEALLKK